MVFSNFRNLNLFSLGCNFRCFASFIDDLSGGDVENMKI